MVQHLLRPLVVAFAVLAAPLVVPAALPDAHATEPEAAPQTAAEVRYEHALRLMRRGSYTRALEELNRVRNFHRDDPVSILAELAIADLYFQRGDFEQARLAYEDFARLHPRHDQLDYVVYRIGLSIFRRAPRFAGRDQTATEHAINTWTGFDQRFPDSEHRAEVEELLEEARERVAAREIHVARFYARRDAWPSVARRTAHLLTRHPDSAHVPEALKLQGEAFHATGQIDAAKAARARLEAAHPSSRWLARLDGVLDRPAGEPPEDEVFFRPYRVRPMMPAGPGGP